jgi:redox-sensitive bicupin YhaK (pirin superfamily)
MTAPSPQGRSGLVVRRAEERFLSEHDWLKSWHSFSFAGHDDPAWRGFGPLRVINDDQIAAGQGFGMHPHRDLEIITVMVEGLLRHRDSMGNSDTLLADEVQRMSAGTGLVHSEMNPGHQRCRLLQIWIEPSRQGITPSYEQRPFVLGPHWTALIDPAGASGAMAIQRPVRIWRAKPQAQQALPIALQPQTQGWLQLIEGSLEAEGGPLLQRGDGLGFQAGEITTLQSGPTGADVLLFELR